MRRRAWQTPAPSSRCLDAVEGKGEDGLQNEMERMYPGSQREEQMPRLRGGGYSALCRKTLVNPPPESAIRPRGPRKKKAAK